MRKSDQLDWLRENSLSQPDRKTIALFPQRPLRPRRPLPDDIGDPDRLRDQSEAREAVGDGLLGLYDVVINGNDAVVRALDKALDRLDIDAGCGGLRLRDLFMVCIRPDAFGGEHRVETADQRRVFLDKIRSHDDKGIRLVDLFGEDEHAGIALQFRYRQIRVPDRP